MRRGVSFSNVCVVGTEVAQVFFDCCARTGGRRGQEVPLPFSFRVRRESYREEPPRGCHTNAP